MSQGIKLKLAELKAKAAEIRKAKSLRHSPTWHDVAVCRDNAVLLQLYQYQTIKEDNLK